MFNFQISAISAIGVVCGVVLSTFVDSGSGQQGVVTGTVSYRQRIALTPDAVVQVQLQDVSRADAPAIVVAEQTIEPKGKQVPIPFTLNYDPTLIKERSRYAVQAKILVGTTLRFRSTKAYPVITGGNPTKVDILVDPVSPSKAGNTPGSSTPIENTYWKLVEVNGKPVSTVAQRREAHFRLNPVGKKLQGFGGCNRFAGGYEIKEDSIRFKAATTLMACIDSMDTEREFLKALDAATSFKIAGDKLELHGEGGLLARLDAVLLK